MPRKSFRGKSMRPDKGVVVDTETIVKYKKRAKPGKRMVFGSIRAQKPGKREIAEEPRPVRQKSLDDYKLKQTKIEDYRYRKIKALGKKAQKIIEAETIPEIIDVTIREPYRKVKGNIQKRAPEPIPVYAEEEKAKEEVKKKEAKKGEKPGKFMAVEPKDVVMLLAFLLALVIFFVVISWITSMF